MKLRTALLFQHGNYIGREYLHRLVAAGMAPRLLIAAGEMSEQSAAREGERTGGRWNPPALPDGVQRFESLRDPQLWQAIRDADIDIAVQAGIGILKPNMLGAPRVGFLNVHPGRLPAYRGSSCPEWALFNGDDIYATAHLIDDSIDTGPVICAEKYVIEDGWDYHDIRANLYAHCSSVLIKALRMLDAAGDPASIAVPQDRNAGRTWQAIPPEKLQTVIENRRRTAH